MTSAPDPLVGRVLADRFEILERIGEGGTGVVYKAKQLSVDRVIAIKVLGAHVSTDPSWVKRFHNEARAASRLDHPNTVRLIDFGQTKEGLLFIAMEYLHGRSLRQEIDRVRRLPPNRVLRILSQMCSSLSEAHGQGIIHRDIKPDNVFLQEVRGAGDFVKVLDFSIAKLDTPDAQVTRAGVVFGTPAYMSPEQGRGQPLDARSDIYAVGIVAYEMLMGAPPFDAQIPTDVVMMHLRSQPPPLTDVPAPLQQIVLRALAKDPAKRQQTAEELNTECEACLQEFFPHTTGAQRILPPSQPMAPVAAPVAEQKTMMAMEAPKVASSGKAEQKTVLGAAAPSLPPPPAAGPPPLTGPSAPPTSVGAPSVANQRTVMAEAPSVAPKGNVKTVMLDPNAPTLPPLGAGTQLLPDSQGVVAYARAQAAEARAAIGDGAPAAPAGALFWVAWTILGAAIGLGAAAWVVYH